MTARQESCGGVLSRRYSPEHQKLWELVLRGRQAKSASIGPKLRKKAQITRALELQLDHTFRPCNSVPAKALAWHGKASTAQSELSVQLTDRRAHAR